MERCAHDEAEPRPAAAAGAPAAAASPVTVAAAASGYAARSTGGPPSPLTPALRAPATPATTGATTTGATMAASAVPAAAAAALRVAAPPDADGPGQQQAGHEFVSESRFFRVSPGTRHQTVAFDWPEGEPLPPYPPDECTARVCARLGMLFLHEQPLQPR
jgi:hypothetical protein